MKEVKDKVDQLAKRNKGVNADQVREALGLCEELPDAGIAPQQGVGYRLSTPLLSGQVDSTYIQEIKTAKLFLTALDRAVELSHQTDRALE